MLGVNRRIRFGWATHSCILITGFLLFLFIFAFGSARMIPFLHITHTWNSIYHRLLFGTMYLYCSRCWFVMCLILLFESIALASSHSQHEHEVVENKPWRHLRPDCAVSYPDCMTLPYYRVGLIRCDQDKVHEYAPPSKHQECVASPRRLPLPS